MLSFKELLAVDYTDTGDAPLAYKAKKRKTSEELEITDSEIIESLNPEDRYDMELQDLLSLEEAILTPAQRARKAQLLRRSKAKIQIGRMIASRRLASKQTIAKRAKKRARGMMLKKLLKNRSKGDLSYSARGGYEKMLSARKGATARIARKITPQVRRDDQSKFQHKSQ